MAEEKQSWAQVLAGYAKAVAADVGQTAERMAAHGASELASALYTGQSFVTYGWGSQSGDPVMDGSVHGPQGAPASQQQSGPEPSVQTQDDQPSEASYAATVALYASRGMQSQQTRENDRDSR